MQDLEVVFVTERQHPINWRQVLMYMVGVNENNVGMSEF